jgi:hypothetical protein
MLEQFLKMIELKHLFVFLGTFAGLLFTVWIDRKTKKKRALLLKEEEEEGKYNHLVTMVARIEASVEANRQEVERLTEQKNSNVKDSIEAAIDPLRKALVKIESNQNEVMIPKCSEDVKPDGLEAYEESARTILGPFMIEFAREINRKMRALQEDKEELQSLQTCAKARENLIMVKLNTLMTKLLKVEQDIHTGSEELKDNITLLREEKKCLLSDPFFGIEAMLEEKKGSQ